MSNHVSCFEGVSLTVSLYSYIGSGTHLSFLFFYLFYAWWFIGFVCQRFFVMCVLQQLSVYIKSKQDYERERSLFITSILLTECLSCVNVLAVSLCWINLFWNFFVSQVVCSYYGTIPWESITCCSLSFFFWHIYRNNSDSWLKNGKFKLQSLKELFFRARATICAFLRSYVRGQRLRSLCPTKLTYSQSGF